jgi:hypothetical protein
VYKRRYPEGHLHLFSSGATLSHPHTPSARAQGELYAVLHTHFRIIYGRQQGDFDIFNNKSPRKYSYFDVVVGLVCSDDAERYAGGSAATGRAFHARQVKGDDQDKKYTLVLQVAGLGVGLTTPPHKNVLLRSF